VLSGKKIRNETKNHNPPPLQVKWSVPKYNVNDDILIMGDLNTHINCNERDFIQNDLDDVLDSFLSVVLYCRKYSYVV
jgi:hypothetical protein